MVGVRFNWHLFFVRIPQGFSSCNAVGNNSLGNLDNSLDEANGKLHQFQQL